MFNCSFINLIRQAINQSLDTWNISDGVTGTTESSDQNFVVLLDVVQTTVLKTSEKEISKEIFISRAFRGTKPGIYRGNYKTEQVLGRVALVIHRKTSDYRVTKKLKS